MRSSAEDPPETPRGTWHRVPLSLRLTALVSGCLLLISSAVFVLGRVAGQLFSLVIALAAALLLTALLEPVVAALHRLRVPRPLGAIVAITLLLALFATPAVLLGSLTAGQFDDLSERVRDGVGRMRSAAVSLLRLDDRQLDDVITDVEGRVRQLAIDAMAGAFTLVEVLAAVALALFVTFFLLKDGPAVWAWALAQLPQRVREPADKASDAAWDTLTRYVRGTLIVAAIDAVGIGIALAIIGVPLVLPLALLVFVGGFVPYIGSTVSGAVAVLVALATNGPVDALLVLVSVVAVQQLEGNFLEPFIVGRQVRLHPAVVVVVIFAGALTAGVAGAILAVPLTAVAFRVGRVLKSDMPPSRNAVPSGADERRRSSPGERP